MTNMPEVLFPKADQSIESEKKFSVRRIVVADSEGKKRSYRHPELVDAPNDTPLHDSDEVFAVASEKNQPEKISFSTYLGLLGADYNTYYASLKKYASDNDEAINNNDILYRAHEQVIRSRTERTRRLAERHDQEYADRHNFQKETRAHSIVFQKIFNDLRLDDIEVEEAEQEVDKLDGIDEYLHIHGHTIGIQRSFKNKEYDVENDHWRRIPEHPEFGRIVRVPVTENFLDYGLDANGQGTSLAQRLYDKRSERAAMHGKKPNELPLPNVISVLGASKEVAMKEQGKRAVRTLDIVLKELSKYRDRASDEEVRHIEQLMSAVQSGLDEVRQELRGL